jgi:hypothetical protein
VVARARRELDVKSAFSAPSPGCPRGGGSALAGEPGMMGLPKRSTIARLSGWSATVVDVARLVDMVGT